MRNVQKNVPERKVGFAEGIDDEAIAIVFSKLQNFPQFKIIRNIPLKAVFNNIKSKNVQILDFGCGSGHFLIDLYKKSRRQKMDLLLFGLDIAQTMLDQCLVSFKRKKIKNIKLLLGDGKKIPSEDNFFDIISTSLSLHHWGDPEQIFTEIYRVIKPGGKFILFDFHRTASKGWYNFLTFITKHIVPKALRNANEPLGSLLSSYTQEEISRFIKNTPWNKEIFETTYHGPFIQLLFIKKTNSLNEIHQNSL